MEENKSVMEKSWDAIKNMNEDFAANILFAMILVVSILALVYHFYLSGLLKRECSFMDSLYGLIYFITIVRIFLKYYNVLTIIYLIHHQYLINN